LGARERQGERVLHTRAHLSRISPMYVCGMGSGRSKRARISGEEKEEKKKKRKEKKRKEKKRKKKEKKKKKTVGNDDRVLAVPERSRLPAADGDRTARSPR